MIIVILADAKRLYSAVQVQVRAGEADLAVLYQ